MFPLKIYIIYLEAKKIKKLLKKVEKQKKLHKKIKNAFIKNKNQTI